MADKVYHLCAELIINGEKQIATIAKGNLLALEKYTSFCSGPLELLRTMPDKEDFSSKVFLEKYLIETNEKNNPFSIRTSNAKGSRNLPLLYKRDIDILLTNKEEVIKNIRDNYKITIDDIECDNIDEGSKIFCKQMWELFYDQKVMNAFYEYIDNKLDPDKQSTFDERYEKVLKNKWMIIGISKTVLEKFIKLIYQDPRKRIEFLSYLKENYRHIIPEINSLEKQKRLDLLENELTKKRMSTGKIRKQITQNLSDLNKSLISKNIKLVDKKDVKTYKISEQEIIRYNEERRVLTPIMERILKLSKELERLNLEILIASGEIKEKIEQRITEIEFEIYELENNKYSYTDSGILIKEDEMIK